MSFTFNGVSSDNYKVTVEKCPSYPVAQRVVEHIQVPGRNGDLIRDTGAYGNVEQTYSIWFDGRNDSMQEAARAIALWLNGSKGYCRLEDTYDQDVYRMAVMSNYTEYRNFRNRIGRADVTFSCKPQRWLKSGESLQDFTYIAGVGQLANPYMDCYPIYAVTGATNITVDGSEIVISNNSGKTLYIDSETQDCWSGSLTRNDTAILTHASVSSGSTTASRRIPFSLTGLTNIYLSYSMGSWGGHVSGVLEIPVASNFSQTITHPGNLWAVTVSKSANNPNITFTWVSGILVSISSSVSTVYNRNEDVTGTIVGVPHGVSQLTKSFSPATVQWIPRWWVL